MSFRILGCTICFIPNFEKGVGFTIHKIRRNWRDKKPNKKNKESSVRNLVEEYREKDQNA